VGRVGESDGEYTLLIPYGVSRTLEVEDTSARDRIAGLALLSEGWQTRMRLHLSTSGHDEL